MTLYVIGENNESNKVIVDFVKEYNLDFEFSNQVMEYKYFINIINKAITCDVIIIDVLSLMIDESEFESGLIKIRENFSGIVIIYAPGAQYNNERIVSCNKFGFDNVVRDFLAARAKARFKSLIPNLEQTANILQENMSETNNTQSINQYQEQSQQNENYQDYTQQQRPEQRQNYPSVGNQVQYSVPTIENNQKFQFQNTYEEPNQYSVNQRSSYQQPTYNQPVQNYYRQEQPLRETKQVQQSSDSENIVVTKKIGVIGVLPRIGTTTQAIMIANTLKSLGKTACYIQYHESSFLNNMENYFVGVEKSASKGCLTYEGLDFFENRNLVLSQSYDYHIRDYGMCERNEAIPSDFFDNDIRVIVCGGTAEEVSRLTEMRTQLYVDNGLIYVFSFIADYERNDIMDLMGDKTNPVVFAPYTPDCFNLTEEAKSMYMSVLGFNVDKPKAKKKKGFGFKRKKG